MLGASNSQCVGGAAKEDSHDVGVRDDKGAQNALGNRKNRVRGSVIVVKGEWEIPTPLFHGAGWRTLRCLFLRSTFLG